mgnify:CR=1 FL=1
MRIPYSLQGAVFGPVFILIVAVLKMLCPTSVGAECFADHLAAPIFLPLIFVYKIVGSGWVMIHELWFIVIYWSLVGFLIGLIFDLYTRRSQYSPAPRRPL